MTDSTDLAALVSSLSPVLRPGRYVFVTTDSLPPGVQPAAMVEEDEGRSFVVSMEDAERHALPFDFVAAWITLTVSSSLSAVGLTSAVSAALSAAGIGCNVIAGHHHDHLLVPAEQANETMIALDELSGRA